MDRFGPLWTTALDRRYLHHYSSRSRTHAYTCRLSASVLSAGSLITRHSPRQWPPSTYNTQHSPLSRPVQPCVLRWTVWETWAWAWAWAARARRSARQLPPTRHTPHAAATHTAQATRRRHPHGPGHTPPPSPSRRHLPSTRADAHTPPPLRPCMSRVRALSQADDNVSDRLTPPIVQVHDRIGLSSSWRARARGVRGKR